MKYTHLLPEKTYEFCRKNKSLRKANIVLGIVKKYFPDNELRFELYRDPECCCGKHWMNIVWIQISGSVDTMLSINVKMMDDLIDEKNKNKFVASVNDLNWNFD